MKKLLLLLLLIPNLVMAGFDVERVKADGLSDQDIKHAIEYVKSLETQKEERKRELKCSNLTKKEQK